MGLNRSVLCAVVFIIASIPSLGIGITGIELLVFLLAFVALLQSSNSHRSLMLYGHPSIFLLFLTISLVTLISIVNSFNTIEAAKIAAKWLEITALFACAGIVFRYYLSLDPHSIELILYYAVLGMVFSAVIGTPEVEVDDGLTFRIRVGAWIVIPWALLLPQRRNNTHYKVLFWIFTGLILISFSRSAWLGSFLVVLIYAYNMEQRFSRKIGFACLVFLFFLAFLQVPLVADRFMTLNINDVDVVAYSTYQRIYRVFLPLIAWWDFPFFGVGGNNLFYYLEQSGSAYLSDWYNWLVVNERNSVTPHNVYLQFLGEHGIFGFSVFVLLNYRLMRHLRFGLLSQYSDRNIGLYLSFFAMQVFLLTGYISESKRFLFVLLVVLFISANVRKYDKI